MISEIRSYFKTRIKEENSDLKANKSPIAIENVSNNIIENTYLILIGAMSSERTDTDIRSTISVSVELYKKGGNKDNKIESYDKAYCEAINIQANCMYQPHLSQETALKSVVSSGIETDSVEGNENIYKFTIQFEVTTAYTHAV